MPSPTDPTTSRVPPIGGRRIFRDDVHQERYERDGFVIVRLLSPEECRTCLDRHAALPRIGRRGFFNSQLSRDPDYKRAAHRALREFGDRAAREHLLDYVTVVATFVTKEPGADSVVPPHLDMSIVDERVHASLNVWFPLVDTGYDNGALHVVRGSHHLPHTVRGSNMRYRIGSGTIPLERMFPLPLEAGEAVIYDHRLIHASPPNLSDAIRVAGAIAVAPREAPIVHYALNPRSGKIECWATDADFFDHYFYDFGKNERPPHLPLIAEHDVGAAEIGDADLAPLLEPG